MVSMVAFMGILWALSGTFTVSLGWFSLSLPGYMVWAAMLYAIGGTWLTDWIGRPLVGLNFDKQRCEADFRFRLVRFREDAGGSSALPRRVRTSYVLSANDSKR